MNKTASFSHCTLFSILSEIPPYTLIQDCTLIHFLSKVQPARLFGILEYKFNSTYQYIELLPPFSKVHFPIKSIRVANMNKCQVLKHQSNIRNARSPENKRNVNETSQNSGRNSGSKKKLLMFGSIHHLLVIYPNDRETVTSIAMDDIYRVENRILPVVYFFDSYGML